MHIAVHDKFQMSWMVAEDGSRRRSRTWTQNSWHSRLACRHQLCCTSTSTTTIYVESACTYVVQPYEDNVAKISTRFGMKEVWHWVVCSPTHFSKSNGDPAWFVLDSLRSLQLASGKEKMKFELFLRMPIVLTICPCKEYEEQEMKKWHCCWMCRLFLVATAALAVAPIIVTGMQFQNYTHHKIKPNMYNTVQMMPEPFCRKVFHCCLTQSLSYWQPSLRKG